MDDQANSIIELVFLILQTLLSIFLSLSQSLLDFYRLLHELVILIKSLEEVSNTLLTI